MNTEVDDETIHLLPGAGDIVIQGSGNTVVIDPGFTGTFEIEGDGNVISGSNEDDLMKVTGCGNTILGGAGNDRTVIRCDFTALGRITVPPLALARTVVEGGPGSDVVRNYGSGADIYGSAGNDRLQGGAGGDAIFGGWGRDVIQGRGGNDLLRGGAASDRLFGGSRSDRILAGPGYNYMFGGMGGDICTPRDVPNYIRGCDDRTRAIEVGGLLRSPLR